MQKGFTLIELIVTMAIIAVLSGIILFSVTQYINKGKDSNVAGNLAVLVPAGEVYYNGNNNSYQDFCDPIKTSVVKNAISQMPKNPAGNCYDESKNPAGICCYAESQAWAACGQKFTDKNLAFCVDSRGVKTDINSADCKSSITQCRN
ncbi:MAG: hypothetical protein A2358_04330 [Candidatus Staskawiczbacteria bacterium RIFOXYB1_FULL_37_44]|uniref:Type II secretion system protein GspG C-terminal domain-containing protein n=1 Tax=Candidatus Staskawiczbacteria bacterium RIFOXYB1_FULL_37_44 TaxID=1802223 RepID=A0A1G2IXY1_9BACT|nr:MAG: hypothetical protein A2358_04330 [Candidatus Staskawiczbacteria bacterium RIFOXYB1_FULL_37_44]OGZ84792.1 MAG: hypothetical protein A2416_00560 [Candidatus Staskawiczbacteria bacterium RIFOXYC1_FULL_37_52]OGZ88079.1 MAG: hypothetical protein A2444_00340 [Candidatus Staskawiczbacteria bacterium RIFOXYC2_FULL_37_19]